MRARPPQPPLPGATAVTDDELGAVLERFAATFVLRARRERPRLLADPRRRDVELGAVSAWIDRSLASELRDRVPPALRGTPGILLLRGRAPGRVPSAPRPASATTASSSPTPAPTRW